MVTGDEEIQWAYLIGPCFQLENTAGKPLTGGYLEVYIAGTRDKYYCASDFAGTLHPFQIPLDSLGSNIVLASPTNVYDIYVYNKFGSLVMSRYNVMCTNGSADISVTGFTSVISDGTLDVSVTGNSFIISAQELWDAVSGLVNDVQTVSSALDSVSGMLDGKKDIQVPYIASGTNVQTITKITQDEQGVMTVEYSDIQAQNPLTPGQYVTIDNDVISVTGLQPEGDYLEQGDLDGYATEEFVTAYVEEHGGDDQVQSDWAQTDSEAVDYIKNKPAEKVLVAGDHIDITSTASSVEISAEGFATENFVVDYVDSAVSAIDPVDIISSDGTLAVSSTVSGSVKVFDLSVSGGQPVYFRGGETWVPVSGTTTDFSRVKKFDGTIVPSDTVSGIVPLGEGLWAWDAIVDIYVGGHVNELVKCGIKGQAVGNGYDPDSETELLIDSTRPGVINSFTLTGLSRGGSNAHLAFTFTRENTSTSTMWVRMRRLSVYQVKGPGVSQSGGGGDYEAGYGIIINNNVISVNSALIPDIETVTNMIDASIDGLATEDYVTGYVESQVSGLQPAGDYLVQSDLDDYATHDEVNTVSGAIVNLIPDTSDFATHSEVNTVSGAIVAMIPEIEITPTLASGTKIAEYSIDGVSGELFAPEGGGETEIFFATYNTTTFNEITQALEAGKTVFMKRNVGVGYVEWNVLPMTAYFRSNNPNSSYVKFAYVTRDTVIWGTEFKVNGNNSWTTTSLWNVGSGNVNQYLGVDSYAGNYFPAWKNLPSSPTYTAGNYIDITGDVISVTGLAPQVQSDWSVSATDAVDYIKNKPETVEVETTEVIAGSGIDISETASGVVISCTVPEGVTEEFVTAYVESQVSGIPTYSAGDGIDIDNGVISLDDPVNLIAGNNINISVSGVSAVISSTGGGGSDPVSGGNCISVNSNVVSWITTAGITDIVSAATLPANPVSTVIYLIPEA